MNNLNTFWHKARERKEIKPGETLTVPGLSVKIQDLIKQGRVTDAEKESRKRMIYGQRIKLEDLTKLDYFSNILHKHNNLIRTRELQSIETPKEDKVSNLDKIKGKVTKESELDLMAK